MSDNDGVQYYYPVVSGYEATLVTKGIVSHAWTGDWDNFKEWLASADAFDIGNVPGGDAKHQEREDSFLEKWGEFMKQFPLDNVINAAVLGQASIQFMQDYFPPKVG